MTVASRSYMPVKGTLGQSGLVILTLQWTGNGTSAPVLTSAQKKYGVSSITRSAAGDYLVTLDKNYGALLGWCGNVHDDTDDTSWIVQVEAKSLTASGGSTFTVLTLLAPSGDGSAHTKADPATADTVYLTLFLGTSQI